MCRCRGRTGRDASKRDGEGLLASAADGGDVELEADEEQEEKQAEIGQRVQHRHALGWEHGVQELVAAAQRRRAQQNSSLHQPGKGTPCM